MPLRACLPGGICAASADYTNDEYGDMNAYQEFVYVPDRHETSAKTFSFPIYANGSHTIPARDESEGMQDGLDLITALAFNPETARRLARKLWEFFVSEITPPDPDFVESTAAVYLQNNTEMRPVIRHVLSSGCSTTRDLLRALFLAVEFVGRAIREVAGRTCRSTDPSPLANMGQLLFEPPNVGGWPLGAGWFSTGTMLARMNFSATLASNQKAFLAAAVRTKSQSPQTLLTSMLDRITPAPLDSGPREAWWRTWPPPGRGPALASSSTREPPVLRACWSAPPNINWFREAGSCRSLDDSLSATALPRSPLGWPRHPS